MSSELIQGISSMNMSASMWMGEFVYVSVDPRDIVSRSWWSMSRLFSLKENTKTRHAQPLVGDVRDEREVLHVTSAL